MKRLIIFAVAIIVVVGALVFMKRTRSVSDPDVAVPERGAEHAQRTTGNEPYVRPDYYPKANPYGGLAKSTLDTLRRYKKTFEITRDEYWPETGGVLANQYFEVWYPPGRVTVTHGMRFFIEIMPARAKFAAFFGSAPEDPLIIYNMSELDVYRELTGREWWYYSVIEGDTMTSSPIFHLVKRSIVHLAVPREYYQWAVTKTSRDGAPRWLQEGLASYLAREHLLLTTQMYEFPERNEKYELAELESVLENETERAASRRAYYYSWRMVSELIDKYGEEKVRDVVVLLGQGYQLEEAFEEAFGESYDNVIAVATGYTLDLQTN